MMQELSLNVLDVAENSVRAGATLIEITVEEDTAADRLTITDRRVVYTGCQWSEIAETGELSRMVAERVTLTASHRIETET